MDVKTALLNGDFEETKFIKEPDCSFKKGKEHLVCQSKKVIYGLSQALQQWHAKMYFFLFTDLELTPSAGG